MPHAPRARPVRGKGSAHLQHTRSPTTSLFRPVSRTPGANEGGRMSNPASAARTLPPNPNLEQQKKQARELLEAARRGDQDARRRFRDFHPEFAATGSRDDATQAALHDAQLVIAREYGFASWAKLKQHIESVASSIGQLELL